MLDKIETSDKSDKSDTSDSKKPRRESVIKYPATVSVAITGQMVESLKRLNPANGPTNQSSFLRDLLHRCLLMADPQYRAAMGNGHDQGGNHDA
jgi:hypothetical protein